MTRYWAIAPYDARESEIWAEVWDYDYTNGLIAIGWGVLGDLSALNEQEIRVRVVNQWPMYTAGAATSVARMLYKFYHEIEIGDQIIVRRGVKRIAGLGTVTGKGHFNPDGLHEVFERFPYDDGSVQNFPHQLKVSWDEEICSSEYEFDAPMFGMQTLYELPKEKFDSLMGREVEAEISLSTDITTESQIEFVLEKYLEEFIISNFDAIFKGQLRILEAPEEGPIGRQFRTDVGNIDILAQDVSTNALVVIELKRGRGADKVVGQILKYMGWISENLCKNGEEVQGVIICKDFDAKLLYAIKMTQNIAVKYYRIDFKLRDEAENLWGVTS